MSKQDLINKIKSKADKNRPSGATAQAPAPSANGGSAPVAVPAQPVPAAGDNLWIHQPRPNPDAKMRLFCFHYAGGSRAMYNGWEKKIPPEYEVCAVQLPGRENRMTESPYRDFYPLIQAIGKAMTPYLDRPFAFFGHCMGALTSFEVARQLRRTNQPMPVRMFLSSFIGPQLADENPKSDIMRISGDQIDDFFDILGGTPDEILENLGLMSMNRPILQADVDLLNGYQYVEDDPLDVPFSAFGATNDKLVYIDEIEEWQKQTTGGFSLRLFPGDHFYLFSHNDWLMKSLVAGLRKILA